MKADTIEGLLKEYSQFLEEEKVDLLREEGGRLWRANNELKKKIARGEKKMDEIDALITRHKATLDMLAKPALNIGGVRITPTHAWARTEPAQECGCLDKAKMLDRLKVWMKTDNEEIKSALEEEDFTTAARYKASLTNHRHIEGLILRGKFDRAPCKPEPAPSKPALDKGAVLDALDRVFPHPELSGAKCIDLLRFCENVRQGVYDGWTSRDRPHERQHKCRCSTANLVEQLRARASSDNWISITDLDAHQDFNFKATKPMTMIAVRRDRS